MYEMVESAVVHLLLKFLFVDTINLKTYNQSFLILFVTKDMVEAHAILPFPEALENLLMKLLPSLTALALNPSHFTSPPQIALMILIIIKMRGAF